MVDQRFAVSIHIMTALAYHDEAKGRVTSDFLASSVRTNPTVVRRLVSRLAEAGLLNAYKGKTGGVELARRPNDISLKDIYNAVLDRQLLTAPDKSPKKVCPVSCSMRQLLDDVFNGLEDHSMSYLGQIKLADLVKKIAD